MEMGIALLLKPFGALLFLGLVAAIEWLAGEFERRTGIRTTVRAALRTPEVPKAVQLTAYRTAQEALTNIAKHAQASEVRIELSDTEGLLTLEISDNGRGLSNQDLGKERSFGIRGLHERADTVGGWIDLSSSPTGTTLILSVPLDVVGTSSRPGDTDIDLPLGSPHDPSTWGAL